MLTFANISIYFNAKGCDSEHHKNYLKICKFVDAI